MRQETVKVFSEHGLSITIFINLKKVNFLDITMDLENEIYKPYRKPGDRPRYVHTQSNHPPQILKNIPAGIEKRLVMNSCNEEVFLEAVTDYQNELERCGYSYKMAYNPPAQPPATTARRRGGRRVTWFNPPYSLDVATNMAREFFRIGRQTLPTWSSPPQHLQQI